MLMQSVNYVIAVPFFCFLLLLLCLGFWARRKMVSQLKRGGSYKREYYVAGRSIGPIALAFTFMATFSSAGSFIGWPAKAHVHGLVFCIDQISQMSMAFFAFLLVGKRIGQITRRIDAISIPDILRVRFQSKSITIGAVIAIVILYTGYMVAQFMGGARVLQAVSGLPFMVGVIMFAAVVAIFTGAGGFRAIAMTDVACAIFMITGVWVVVAGLILKGGSLPQLTEKLFLEDPQLVFAPGVGNIRPLKMMISFWFLWVLLGVGMPTTTSRFLTYKNTLTLHKALVIATIASTAWYFALPFIGSMSRAALGSIHPADLTIPRTYMGVLPNWLAGIILSAPFAAVISTASAFFLIIVTAIVKDLVLNYISPHCNEHSIKSITISIVIALSVISIFLVKFAPQMLADRVTWACSGLNAAFIVPLLAALYWKRATKWGGIAAFFGGFLSFIIIDLTIKNPLGMLSFLWATMISAVLMVVVSHSTKPTHIDILRVFYGDESELNKVSDLEIIRNATVKT